MNEGPSNFPASRLRCACARRNGRPLGALLKQRFKRVVPAQAGEDVFLDPVHVVHISEGVGVPVIEFARLQGQYKGTVHYPALLFVVQPDLDLAPERLPLHVL
jgi:hypothetical protein